MKSYVINECVFKSKKAVIDRVRQILWSYKDGDCLSANDFNFMSNIFQLHPNFVQKAGVGIKDILVKTNAIYSNVQEFWIIRIDATQTDISYLECLSPTSHKKRFYRACRVAIEPYTMRFKSDVFCNQEYVICPFTNEKLSFVGSHVDHVPPKTFSRLIDQFISEYAIDIDSTEILGRDDGVVQDTFADVKLQLLWVDYHQTHADLRVISPKANLSHVKRSD